MASSQWPLESMTGDERDRREAHWLDVLTRKLPADDAAKTKGAALEVVELLEKSAKHDSRFVNSPEFQSEQNRFIQLIQRRGEYVEMLEKLKGWLEDPKSPVSHHGIILVMASTLLQILEGGLKSHLRLMWWAAVGSNGGTFSPNWDATDKKYLIHALAGIRKELPDASLIRQEFEPFWDEKSQNFLNRIRRGLAHADYVVTTQDGEIGVDIEDKGELLFLSGSLLWEICRRILDVELTFHAGLHLGKCRIDGDLPYLPSDASQREE